MERQLVYDLPTRIFHWLFAAFFLTAFVIAKVVDDDSPVFSYHSLMGLTIGFLVLLRIVWGFVGTQHARFTNFALRPNDLVGYFKNILSGKKKRWAGHNPASSWAAILMMIMAIGLGVTGYLMTSGGDKETFEDLHELLANGFIILVVLHIAGIALYSLRYKEMIGLSMIDGKKASVPMDQTITSSRPGMGILFAGLIVAFGVHLYKNYDSQNQRLQFFGTTLQLGESDAEHDHKLKHDDEHEDEVDFE